MDEAHVSSTESLTDLLSAANSVRIAYERCLKAAHLDANITGTRGQILSLLHESPSYQLAQYRIGEKLNLTSSAITYLVDRLERASLTERIVCASNRRITFAKLTPSGLMAARDLRGIYRAFADEVLRDLAEYDRTTLSQLLLRVQSHATNQYEASPAYVTDAPSS